MDDNPPCLGVEGLKRVNEFGAGYWSARDIQR